MTIEQAEIRRRLRAAMALAGVASWEALAERTPFSRSLLKDLGTSRAEADEKHLRPIAAALGVPYAWFTEPDLLSRLEAEPSDPRALERIEALEAQMQTVLRIVTGKVAESLGPGAEPQGDHAGRADPAREGRSA